MDIDSFLAGMDAVARHRSIAVMISSTSERLSHADTTRHLSLDRAHPRLAVVNPGEMGSSIEFWSALIASNRLVAAFTAPEHLLGEHECDIIDMMHQASVPVVGQSQHLVLHAGRWISEDRPW